MIKIDGNILVTGAAGFIGAALTKKLIENGMKVIGIDNLNDYYDTNLKKKRIEIINQLKLKNKLSWNFYKCDISNEKSLKKIFSKFNPRIVINLAAQAGVRYSLTFPEKYITSNLVGFSNILENCIKHEIEHLIFASSSSVYGGNKELPFSEDQNVDNPVSLYGATKKSNELMAHAYSHLYNLPVTGLRFFTVYGPWGRPDMAPMKFTKSILNKEPIDIYNNGNLSRDFTYIDDIIQGIYRCCFKPATIIKNKMSYSLAPYRVFNIGNGKPIKLMDFINLLEKKLDIEAVKNFLPMQQGDVFETFANTENLRNWIKYKPNTNLDEGLDKFVEWYKNYYLSDNKISL